MIMEIEDDPVTRVPFHLAPHGEVVMTGETVFRAGGFGMEPLIYPVTIAQARYNGTYEGGGLGCSWLAFPVRPRTLGDDPAWDGWDGGDVECARWWDHANQEGWPIGHAAAPTLAYDNLVDRVCALAGVSRKDFTREPTLDRDKL
jgi:hypothetical protein